MSCSTTSYPTPSFGGSFDYKSCPAGFSAGSSFGGYPSTFGGSSFGGYPSTFGGSSFPSTFEGRTWGWPSTFGGSPSTFGGFPGSFGGYTGSSFPSTWGAAPSTWGWPSTFEGRNWGFPSTFGGFGGFPSTFGEFPSTFGGFPGSWESSRYPGWTGSFPTSEWARFSGYPSEIEGGRFGGFPTSRFGGETSTFSNVAFRPASSVEYYSLTNPIRVLDREGNRCLWLCYELKGFKPEECNVTFDKKERSIIVEAIHDVKEGKEHHVTRKFYRKFVLPETLAKIDLSTIELKSHFSAEGFLYIECTLPKLTAEELAKFPTRWSQYNDLPYRRNFAGFSGIYDNARPITVKTA